MYVILTIFPHSLANQVPPQNGNIAVNITQNAPNAHAHAHAQAHAHAHAHAQAAGAGQRQNIPPGVPFIQVSRQVIICCNSLNKQLLWRPPKTYFSSHLHFSH